MKIKFTFNLPQIILGAVAIVLAVTISPWWLLLLVIHIGK